MLRILHDILTKILCIVLVIGIFSKRERGILGIEGSSTGIVGELSNTIKWRLKLDAFIGRNKGNNHLIALVIDVVKGIVFIKEQHHIFTTYFTCVGVFDLLFN